MHLMHLRDHRKMTKTLHLGAVLGNNITKNLHKMHDLFQPTLGEREMRLTTSPAVRKLWSVMLRETKLDQ